MTVDISQTIQANSQQINADDLTAGPRTVEITNVEAGTSEQPVFLHVAEFPGRTYRPGKSMRRVLVTAWGAEASLYIGRSLTLFNDPTIRFGKDVTGGIRISHMSHIDKPLSIALTVTRGKRAPFTVQPLPTTQPTPDPTPHLDAIRTADTIDALKQAWQAAVDGGLKDNQQVLAATNQRKNELSA